MPPNIQNSLGWLGLQLRAQRERDLQEQSFQREQMAREDRQTEIQNSMAIGKQVAQTMGDAENRKLQLAAMLQKAAEDRALREQLAEKSDVRIRRNQDLMNEDRDQGRDLEIQKFGENVRQFEERLAQVERIAATKAMTDRDPTGAPVATVDSGSLVRGVTPPQAPPSDVVRFTPGELSKAQEDFRKAQGMLPTINEYVTSFQSLKPGDIDASKAQPVPIIGPLLKGAGLPSSANELQRERANKGIVGSIANAVMGEPTQEEVAQVGRQAKHVSASQKFKSDYARLVSGLTVTEQEQKRLDEITAKINSQEFENRPEFQAEAINQFVQTYNDILGNMEADLKVGGSRVGRRAYQVALPGAVAAPVAPTEVAPPPPAAPTSSGGSSAFVPNQELMALAAADPVVSRKLREAEARLPPGLPPEKRMAALQILASKLIPKPVSP